MRLITQPEKSKICGHCCVAMIADTDVDKVVALIGHENGTYGVNLAKALDKLGIKNSGKLKHPLPIELPEKCILNIRYEYEGTSSGHFVVYYEGYIYDPSFPVDIVEINHYKEEFLSHYNGRFTSYLEITPQ